VSVFVSSDRTSIPVGSKWLLELMDAMARADIQIVLCSNESVNRPWINFEVGAARIKGIVTVPICHSGLTPAQLPVPLSESESIAAADPQGLRALYERISKMLDSDIPDAAFDRYAAEIAAFEKEYQGHRNDVSSISSKERAIETVMNPRVLCISSGQFAKLGFENQLQMVLNAFPAAISHERVFTSAELLEKLKTQKFDIVHIAAFVCPRTGDVYFSDVDPNTGESVSPEPDVIGAAALADLLEIAEARLAVIGSCDSLVLGTTLLGVAHVIATNDIVSARMMAAWVENFYRMLPSVSLADAFDFAIKASRAPMRLYARQPKTVDMYFGSARARL